MKVTVMHGVSVWLPQTQTWLYDQVDCLPGEVESHVFCNYTENLNQFQVPNIHALADKLWVRGLLTAIPRLQPRLRAGLLARAATNEHASILHSHFGNRGWADMRAASRASIEHVVTFYGFDVNRLPEQNERWYGRYEELFKHVSLILCEGPHMAECIAQLGCPREKIMVHRLGIRLDKIAYKPRSWDRSETLRVLIAAAFKEKKGIPYALEALGRIKHKVPLEVTLIGDAGNEEHNQKEKRKIADTIDRNGLRSQVRLLGYQPHSVLRKEAYEHHLFLSPSVTASDGDTEGGAPVSLIEMAASGMPVVSTRHCDIPEVILDGKTGLLAGERDVEGLVAALEWLVDNPQRWRDMLDEGRNHIEENYDASRQGERLAEIYGYLRDRKSNAAGTPKPK